MLWLALHLPKLPLDALHHGPAPQPDEAWAVVETVGRQQCVAACNARASDLGVRPGQHRAAAQALAARLHIMQRQPMREHELLAGLAAWALQFSPTVCLDPPAGLLIEIGGCLRYFCGLERLHHLVVEGLRGRGVAAWDAIAPTPLAASWLAQLGTAVKVGDTAELRDILAGIPLARLPWPRERLQRLHALGVRRFGELADLPRAGLARRFPGLCLEMDRALGHANDPRETFVAPEHFRRDTVLSWATDQVEALGFVAKRLLLELAGFLNGRALGVQQVCFTLLHEDKTRTELPVGFGRPTRAADAMLAIVRERLARLALPAPVEAVCLRADVLHPLDAEAFDLFGEARRQGDVDLLLARLAARLGTDAIRHVGCYPDHRPELAWRRTDEGVVSPQLPVGERPGWLLAEPVALDAHGERPWYGEPLRLLGRAERIETGWWDSAAVARDYYRAEGPSGRRYWIYQQRGGAWYLHGLFA